MSRTYGKAQDLIDFTRASGGTALRRVKYGAELVTNGTFSDGSTGWNNSPSLPMDTFEISSGRLHIVNAAGTTQVAYTDDSISLVAGRVYTFSAHLEKAGGLDNWDIDIRQGGQSIVRYFITNTATTENIVVNFVATTTENVVIQITARNTFDGYIDNVSVKEVTFDTSDGDLLLFNHPNNIPRIEYDANGNLLGLLVEESRTNLIPYSENFASGTWVKNGVTVAVSSEIAPDNISDVYTITGSGNNKIYTLVSVSSGTDYSGSVFVKKGTSETVGLNFANVSGGPVFTFSTESFNTISGFTTFVEKYPRGWYRIGWKRQSTITGSAGPEIQVASLGQTVHIYGAQLEAGSFPTSYIPTSGSTATRSADVASLSVSAFGYRQDEGTVIVEAQAVGIKANTTQGLASLYNTSGDRHYLYFYNALVGGVTAANSSTSANIYGKSDYSAGQYVKSAYGYKTDNFASVVDGATPATDNAGSLPSGITALNIGRADSGSTLNGHIKSIKYYPRRLLNTQLQELTS